MSRAEPAAAADCYGNADGYVRASRRFVGLNLKAVHGLLGNESATVFDAKDYHSAIELCSFENQGKFFFFGPNPEGVLIGA